jgi:hypothetical protein
MTAAPITNIKLLEDIQTFRALSIKNFIPYVKHKLIVKWPLSILVILLYSLSAVPVFSAVHYLNIAFFVLKRQYINIFVTISMIASFIRDGRDGAICKIPSNI